MEIEMEISIFFWEYFRFAFAVNSIQLKKKMFALKKLCRNRKTKSICNEFCITKW